MKTARITVAAGIAGVLALAGCAAESNEIMADYPGYSSITEAADASALVVAGEVVDTRTEELRPETSDSDDPNVNPQLGVPQEEVDQLPGVLITISSVRITEVVKGDAAVGDVIEVSQLGGEKDGRRVVERSTTLIDSLDSQVVLFLAAHEDAPFDLINPEQGVLTLDGGNLEALSQSGLEAPATLSELRSEVE